MHFHPHSNHLVEKGARLGETTCLTTNSEAGSQVPSDPVYLPGLACSLYMCRVDCPLGAVGPSRSWCTVFSKCVTLKGKVSEARTVLTTYARDTVPSIVLTVVVVTPHAVPLEGMPHTACGAHARSL